MEFTTNCGWLGNFVFFQNLLESFFGFSVDHLEQLGPAKELLFSFQSRLFFFTKYGYITRILHIPTRTSGVDVARYVIDNFLPQLKGNVYLAME